MVEAISLTALVLAIISGVGVLIKTIGDLIAKSSCYSSDTSVSSNGSMRKRTRKWQGSNDQDE